MDPELDPFEGAQVLEKARNSKGFGAFGVSDGTILGSISGAPDFNIFRNLIKGMKAK